MVWELATTDRPGLWWLWRGDDRESCSSDTEELKARTDETEKRLGIFLLLKGFSADKRTLTTAKRAFHLSCTNMEDDEWTHESDTVGESKGGEHCREESQKT